jgi:hypothetical protein
MAGMSRARLERAWIIGSSAPLPAPLRVASRRRRLARWQLAQARRADVLFVRHPKTGGTWLRALLTRLYALAYGLPSDRVVRYDELSRAREGLPRFLTTSGTLSWERPLQERILADPVLREKKLLFLARSPLDVASSWYNQFTKRTSAFKRELLLAEMRQPFDPARIDRFGFAMHPEIGLPHVIAYHNAWWRIASKLPHALVVRYEDLRADTATELARVGAFLGESFDEAQIRDAVAFGSVENMRELERTGYFRNRSLRLRDGADPDTLKVRRARVGGYREDFTAEQAATLEALVEASLDPGLGYGGAAARAGRIGPSA